MYKKSSAKIPMLIGMILGFISLFKVFYTFYVPSIGDPPNGRYIMAIGTGIAGGFIGSLLGYSLYSMFTPRKKNRPLHDQSRTQYNNNNSKTDELIRLNGLKNSGAISNEEFRNLKSEIINRR
jgi:hypothetical protein